MARTKVLSDAEKQRLDKLLETTPLWEMADEVAAYYKQLRAGGFKKWQAWALTYELHHRLLMAIFPE